MYNNIDVDRVLMPRLSGINHIIARAQRARHPECKMYENITKIHTQLDQARECQEHES